MASSSNWKTDTENTFMANMFSISHEKCIIARCAYVIFFLKGDFNYMYARVALKSELCTLLKYFSLF